MGAAATVRGRIGEKILFQGLTAEQLDRVAEIVKVRELEPGEAVIRERDYGDAIYVVDEGSVHVSTLADGPSAAPRSLAVVAARKPDDPSWEGDFVGEMCLLDLEPRCATVVAAERTRLWEIGRDDLYWLFGDDKGLQLAILLTIARVQSRRLNRLAALARDAPARSPAASRAHG